MSVQQSTNMALIDCMFAKLSRPSRLAFVLGLSGTIVFAGGCRKDTSLLNQGSDAAGSTGQRDEGGAGSDSGGGSGGRTNGNGGTKSGGATQTGGETSGHSTGSGGTSSSNSGGASSQGIGGVGGTNGSGTGSGGTTGASSTTLADPIVEVSEIGYTNSSQPTEMTLYTVGNKQFVGYWNGAKVMSVAMRTIGDSTWSVVNLPDTKFANDAHHSVVLAADSAGYVHVSGKMHSSALVYYRSTTPLGNAATALSTAAFPPRLFMVMGAQNETTCTYPQFFKKGDGTLVYSYRAGVSGQGDTIFNAYDAATSKWAALFGTKLIDGGTSGDSAYIVGPVKGPDGYWHLVWTWRATANAETNHDLSYARTKDFVTWESGTGATLSLPITLATADIVDSVKSGGGLINNNTKIGFDAQNRAVIAYHKNDTPDGFTQLYNARVENGAWVTHKTSDWPYPWKFSGGGTIEFQIVVEGLKTTSTGTLKQAFYHKTIKNGWGGFSLDPVTLKGTDLAVAPLPYPVALNTVDSTNTTAGMRVRWAADSGTSPDPDVYYMMRWETLEANGDAPRAEPPATKLRVYAIRKSTMELWQ